MFPSHSGQNQGLKPDLRPRCLSCRKSHFGECWKLTGGYYKYGEIGHRIRDCLKPSRASRKISAGHTGGVKISVAQDAHSQVPAQVFDLPQPKTKVAPEVITGIEISGRNF